jgi:hypothetical protein
MSIHKPDPEKRSYGAHARNEWICPCGQVTHGNAAEASHKKACRTWKEHQLADIERALAKIRAGVYGHRLKPALIDGFRRELGHQQRRLREHLALPPVIWYRGDPAGRGVLIEDGGGNRLGELRNTRDGDELDLTWGYGGAGPHNTAFSLLVHAQGDRAICQQCQGSGQLVYDPEDGEKPAGSPYDRRLSPEYYAECGLEVTKCWAWNCKRGYRTDRLPDQAFKLRYVARWDPRTFLISQAEIRAWLTGHLGR